MVRLVVAKGNGVGESGGGGGRHSEAWIPINNVSRDGSCLRGYDHSSGRGAWSAPRACGDNDERGKKG